MNRLFSDGVVNRVIETAVRDCSESRAADRLLTACEHLVHFRAYTHLAALSQSLLSLPLSSVQRWKAQYYWALT
ncbi:MAG: hypothetical protein ACREAC_32735, partial [Blastocatellia bacterium]